VRRLDEHTRFQGQQPYAWLDGRRYGVPPSMVSRATERRLAGDWRGACAAARFDVRFDVDRVSGQYGAQVAAALDADLQHLVPDLVRWHAPRGGPGGLLAAGRTVVLADYHDAVLTAHNPRHIIGNQRIELQLSPGRAEDDRQREDWTQARYLWDARQTPGLLRRMGGGDRAPFFHRDGTPRRPDPVSRDRISLVEQVLTLQDAGRVVEAWQAGGVPPVQAFADSVLWLSPNEDRPPEPFSAMVPLLAPAATAMLAVPAGQGGVVLRAATGPDRAAVLLMLGEGGLRAHRISGSLVEQLPAVPRVLWQRMPDLELLRSGLIEPVELHPLVRAALFPEQPDPGYGPRMPCQTTMERGFVTIDCRTEHHRISLADRHIVAANHSTEELERERTLRALGGRALPCVDAVDTWRGTSHGELPADLAELRNHGVAVVWHANLEEMARLLDADIDLSGIRGPGNQNPLHRLADFAEQDPAVAARLLGAGLDLDARDYDGRTALQCALAAGAPPEVIATMRGAGAE
jgi:hypothetical protein